MKEKSIVAIVPCVSYEDSYEALKKGIKLLGGISNFVDINKEILVKTNMLSSASPEKAITSHPKVFEAMVKCLMDEGVKDITYGDSSGSPGAKMLDVAKTCGIYAVGEKYGLSPADFDGHFKCANADGIIAKSFELCNAARTENIIEICKMKTHALENITGAVKNQYGFVYGAHKAKGHAIYPDSKKFAKMLVDLNKKVKVNLHVMDGVIAMEGNGPASGNPTPMKVLLLSTDPVALDSAFARLVYLDPMYVPTCVMGEKYGLGSMDFTVVTPDGEMDAVKAANVYGNPKFDVKRRKTSFWGLNAVSNLYDTIVGQHFEKPLVDTELCIGCGICEEVCPVDGKAVKIVNGKATYTYKKCIRCYCCQEMCPQKAIRKKK
ncbi:MAG: DUF362 domain-containing protein [Clostridia bacterium]|nr:DUF362 domain-containing protein [Clostridia bacterium]